MQLGTNGPAELPATVGQRLGFVKNAYQLKTDQYAIQQDIEREDISDFCEFAKKSRNDLRTRLQSQFCMQDMSGWKGLIINFRDNHAPTIKVREANGFKTRVHGEDAEVQIGGISMSVKAQSSPGSCNTIQAGLQNCGLAQHRQKLR